jgi:1-deoxy-D-xylulose-5-phosphate reductoisomerase
MKRITILGSTGSIGRSALSIISKHRDQFNIFGLTAGKNIALLEKQIKLFSPKIVAVADELAGRALRKRVGRRCTVRSGPQGIEEVAESQDTDFVLSAIVGAAGLMPTLSAIRAGKPIGLANKETLVMAGDVVLREARKYGVSILPVDSEHSAVFQCIEGHKKSHVRRIILTASGGPFIERRSTDMKTVTPREALKHPQWKMGKKISIDSATLMNKGFEVIEAFYLFGIPLKNIDVLIHPQSIVHSIVEFTDQGCIAQLSMPDMKGPIAYALTYPRRLMNTMSGLHLDKIGSLTFRKPDHRRFPCLALAYMALEKGGTMPAVLNASNEIAVHAFLRNMIRFTEIPVIIRKVLKAHKIRPRLSLSSVLAADAWARLKAKEVIQTVRTQA